MTWEYGQQIWDILIQYIGNEIGVSALMGNWVAESSLIPYRVQGDYSSGYAESKEYTAQVDSGTISETDFVHDGPGGGGYGLAQWTYYTRKQGMYNFWKSSGYASIGSVETNVFWCIQEMQSNYPGVWDSLKYGNDMRTLSNMVLHDYEQPADQSEKEEIKRYNYSLEVYNTYGGSGPGPGPGGILPIWLLLYMGNKRRLL